MTTIVRLLGGSLHYPPELVLHTASSGRIAALDELYLVIERDGALAALGEIRENVSYLTGIEPAAVRASMVALLRSLDWSQSRDRIAAQFAEQNGAAPAIACALVDIALVDWAARDKGIPVCEMFGAMFNATWPTNQSLFISGNDQLITMAERYVVRGFRKLKLRVGARAFRDDRARLALLRQHFGDTIELAIDANGAWRFDEAAENLRALADFDLAYVEQPIAAGDWPALIKLAKTSPIPIMLDESVGSLNDIERVIEARGALFAHLKIVKLGGITPTIAGARRLAAAKIPFMIGQMNEGAGATAAAYHCALATQPAHAELYGADGLIDDPVRGISYREGNICIDRAPGLGVGIDTRNLETLWEARK